MAKDGGTLYKWKHICVGAFFTCIALSGNAAAASIVPSADPGVCKLILSGPIEQGDLERFVRVASAVYTPDDEIGESTADNTVCLDSPGGSFVEGIRLARYIFEKGIGTVIDAGSSCASACALMFMMGRAVGPEVSFINRKLHISGSLGFHRPSLVLGEEGEFGTQDVEASYDLAVSSVVEFVTLANKTAPWSNIPMVKADLIERIFATRGNELYLVDTVEKAARWDIELIGVTYPDAIDEVRAYYACENTLQWQVGLHDEPLDFTRLALSVSWSEPYSVKFSRPGVPAQFFSVTSQKAGYAAAGCVVEYAPGWLKVCAVDDYTGTAIGQGPCETGADFETQTVNALALWKPGTRLADINRPWVPEISHMRCHVRSAAGQVLDDENCIVGVGVDYGAGGSAATLQTFHWPSGSRTVVRAAVDRVEINGVSANRLYVEGFKSCLVSGATGNRFCFRDLQ